MTSHRLADLVDGLGLKPGIIYPILLSLGDRREEGRYHETDYRQDHCGGGHANALLVEALHTVANSSKENGGAEREKKTDENRSDDGGFQQVSVTGA